MNKNTKYYFSTKQKEMIIDEYVDGGVSAKAVGRKYGIKDSTIYSWAAKIGKQKRGREIVADKGVRSFYQMGSLKVPYDSVETIEPLDAPKSTSDDLQERIILCLMSNTYKQTTLDIIYKFLSLKNG